MKTIKIEFDAAKVNVDNLEVKTESGLWAHVVADMDERDLPDLLESIGAAKIVKEMGFEAFLDVIGEQDCIDYFDLELKEQE